MNMFVSVPVRARDVILDALRAAGYEADALRAELFTRDYVDPELNIKRKKWVALAQEKVAKEGEIEFDSDATISGSEGGQYVLGWVWVEENKE